MVKKDSGGTGPRGGTTTRYASGKKRTNVVLPSPLADRLEKLASESPDSQSAIVREALTEYLKLLGYVEDDDDDGIRGETRPKNIMLTAQLARLLGQVAFDTQQTNSDIVARALTLYLRLAQEDPDASSST